MRQIEFFVAVAEEMNFTRAAELTHVTQSGLSASIRSLERELKHQLFDRTSRSVALTAAGQAFLPRARRMLADSLAAVRELAQEHDAAGGRVRMAAELCLGDLIDLPDVLSAFRTRYPAVDLHFKQSNAHDILNRIRRGDLDAGLIAGPNDLSVDNGQDIEAFEVARDGFELIMSPGHPLATEDLSWKSLERHVFVDLQEDWTARKIVDNAFRRRRLSRRTAFSVDDVHMLMDLVQRGQGAALVPKSYAAKPQADSLVHREMPDADLMWAVHFVVAAGPERAPRLMADMLLTAHAVQDMRDELDGTDHTSGLLLETT